MRGKGVPADVMGRIRKKIGRRPGRKPLRFWTYGWLYQEAPGTLYGGKIRCRRCGKAVTKNPRAMVVHAYACLRRGG